MKQKYTIKNFKADFPDEQNKARPVWRERHVSQMGLADIEDLVCETIKHIENFPGRAFTKYIEAAPAIAYIKQLEDAISCRADVGQVKQRIRFAQENEKLKLENERLNKYVIAGYETMFQELKLELAEKDRALEFYADPQSKTFTNCDYEMLAREVLQKYKKEGE